jgi:hypothetical protein
MYSEALVNPELYKVYVKSKLDLLGSQGYLRKKI